MRAPRDVDPMTLDGLHDRYWASLEEEVYLREEKEERFNVYDVKEVSQ